MHEKCELVPRIISSFISLENIAGSFYDEVLDDILENLNIRTLTVRLVYYSLVFDCLIKVTITGID
jgi:hypothetical protein